MHNDDLLKMDNLQTIAHHSARLLLTTGRIYPDPYLIGFIILVSAKSSGSVQLFTSATFWTNLLV